jgi:hypothetical protein
MDCHAGINCLPCGQFLEIRVAGLLRNSSIRCKQYGLECTLNRFQSRDSQDALNQIQGALENLDAVKRCSPKNPNIS